MLVIRPETITLTSPSGDDDTMSGVAVAARFAGTHLAVDVQLAGGPLVTVHAPISVRLGTPVTVGVPRAAGIVLAADPTRGIAAYHNHNHHHR